jgi:hypothetical protein
MVIGKAREAATAFRRHARPGRLPVHADNQD